MTWQEIEKAIGFIVDQEAKTSAKLGALTEAQNRNADGIRALLAIAEVHEREIMANSQQITANGEQILALSETTRATDERLNALVNVVERMLSEGRNGKS